MTREQILHKLKDPTLLAHERESLLQYLHYLDVEDIKTKPHKQHKRKRK